MEWDRRKLLRDGTNKYVPWTTLGILLKRCEATTEVENGAKPDLRNSSNNFCQTTKTATRRQCRWSPFYKNPISTMCNR